MASFVQRMIGAAKLDVATYEEVEHDTRATGQAMMVVLLSSLASGVVFREEGAMGFVGGVIAALASWIVWAIVTNLIGTKLLPGPETRSNTGQLLRTIGFAQSPGILRVLGGIPILGWVVLTVTGIWTLITFVVAVRQALDYRGTGRAILVCAIGWVIQLIVFALILGVFGIRPGLEAAPA